MGLEDWRNSGLADMLSSGLSCGWNRSNWTKGVRRLEHRPGRVGETMVAGDERKVTRWVGTVRTRILNRRGDKLANKGAYPR